MDKSQTTDNQAEIAPNDQWDQLAVMQIRKNLAPNGFKDALGERVAAIQFLHKKTIDTTCTMGANMIRLYRELLREDLEAHKNDLKDRLIKATNQLQECRFYEFGKKSDLRKSIFVLELQGSFIQGCIHKLNFVKPRSPKIAPPKPVAKSPIMQANGKPFESTQK